MRWLFYAATIISAISAVTLTVLLTIPKWTPYGATVTVDFARISGITHNFIPNCSFNEYQLRWEVIAYIWLAVIYFALLGIALRHKMLKRETPDDFYEKYIWWLWFGLIITTLVGSFIVATMSGIMTIMVSILLAFASMISFTLLGPIHNQLNENKNDVHWAVFILGIMVQIVYALILLSYFIQSIVWGHSIPWQNWLILVGDLLIRIVIVIVWGLMWTRVKPIVSKRSFVIVFVILTLLHFLWIPWFFFARTVTFTPYC